MKVAAVAAEAVATVAAEHEMRQPVCNREQPLLTQPSLSPLVALTSKSTQSGLLCLAESVESDFRVFHWWRMALFMSRGPSDVRESCTRPLGLFCFERGFEVMMIETKFLPSSRIS